MKLFGPAIGQRSSTAPNRIMLPPTKAFFVEREHDVDAAYETGKVPVVDERGRRLRADVDDALDLAGDLRRLRWIVEREHFWSASLPWLTMDRFASSWLICLTVGASGSCRR